MVRAPLRRELDAWLTALLEGAENPAPPAELRRARRIRVEWDVATGHPSLGAGFRERPLCRLRSPGRTPGQAVSGTGPERTVMLPTLPSGEESFQRSAQYWMERGRSVGNGLSTI
jgi:hypothetical protein